MKWHKQEKEKKVEAFTTNLLKTIQSVTERENEDKVEIEDDNDEYDDVIKKEVNVVRADNPDLIYIQFKDESIRKRFIEMDNNLQEFYSTNKPKMDNLEIGNKCVIYRNSLNHFHRATVLEVFESKVMVQLCDTAEIIEVDKNKIYALNDQFRVYPNFTFKCHLDGILPAGDNKKWSFLAVEYLQEIFKNQNKILMTKSGILDGERNSWPVDMWYVELVCNGPLEPTQRKLHSINKELTTNGLALKKRPLCKKLNRSPTIVQVEENTVAEHASADIEPIEISQILVDYIPAPPITKKKFVGIVTYVDENGVIHLQDYDMQTPFEEMVIQMYNYFKNTEPEPENIVFKAGDLCTVLYRDNKYWYRGKVTKCEEGGRYKVHVIDYGNEELCTHDELRKTVMYVDVPSFSHKVKLNNVYAKDNKWITSDIDMLQAIFDNQKVVVLVKRKWKNNGPTYVDIFTDDGTNANDFIVKYSSNLSKKPFKKQAVPAHHTSDDEDVIIDDIIEEIIRPTQNTETRQPPIYEFTELPSVGTKLEVGIVNVLGYNDLIFEINNNVENEDFVTLSADMQTAGDQQPRLSVIKVGQPCIARYSEDQLWYRAQIVDLLTSDVVKVWFVDFGNFEDVKLADLKEMKQDWFLYPLQQYRAQISNIKLRDEERVNKVINFFTDLCGTVQHAKIVELEPLKIELYKLNSEEEVLYWDLIEEGILAL